jgi:hypothetical protein
MKRVALVAFSLSAPLAALTTTARAQSQADGEAYCRFVTGVADSESALEVAPTLFGTAGLVSGQDVSPGGSLLGPTKRVVAGASYSLSGLYRGLQRRSGAQAECRRYRTISDLHAFLESSKEGRTRASLDARVRVLEGALPKADEMLATARASLQQARTTIEQVSALQLRVDALRDAASEARAERDAMAQAPQPPQRPIAEVLRERDDAEAEAERYEGHVRESSAWDVSVRGGYDQVFGTSLSYTPLFALVTVTANVGGLFQPAAEDRAREGRVAWARRQVEGADDRVQQHLALLRALRESDRKRLTDVRVLLADLESRYKTLSSLGGERVAEAAQVVWFDVVRMRAEDAYLTAHLADLDRLLGPQGAR